jgi:hypothetical protein
MDLSRCHNGGLASGMVLPRPPGPGPEMVSKNGKADDKLGSASPPASASSSAAVNPKTAFFSISNLVNGLRQQQEKGKWAFFKDVDMIDTLKNQAFFKYVDMVQSRYLKN